MSIFRSALDRRPITEAEAFDAGTYGQPGHGYWSQGMVWRGSAGGDAMQLSAVYACLRLLSEAVATLPLDTFTRADGARLPYRPRPTYLSFDPPQGSRITYLSQVMLSLLTAGNAFVATPRDQFGEPITLVVIDPAKVTVGSEKGRPTYTIDGHPFGPLDIMHISGMTLPGTSVGVSPLTAARSVVEGATAAQDYGTNFIANASVPPAVIEVPGGSGDPVAERDRAKRIAQTWNDTHGGTSNAGKVGVLLGGATLKSVAVNPVDAQWLESRQFSVQEIARIYGVPPHLIADSSNSTSWGSGLAEQNLAFGQLSLRPWLERIEDAHGRLLTTHGLPDVFMKLNLDALLRASLKDRYEADAIGISSGFLTINEARRLEDLPPVPWGDQPYQPPTPGGAPA